MDAAAAQALILDNITDFGLSALAVLGGVIVIGVGFLVFKMGWAKLKSIGRG